MAGRPGGYLARCAGVGPRDVAAGNFLVRDGRLSAVIDFGSSAVGDPACDVTIAWTLLSGASREAFRQALPLDAATWARGRGWALWKALIVFAGNLHTNPAAAAARRVTTTRCRAPAVELTPL